MDDIVRIGKVAAIDYEKGTASVVYTDRNNEPSPQFPFFSCVYDMPRINDTVAVLLLPNSSTKGFILGVPWSRAKVPKKGGKGIFYKEFSDGSYIRYDPSGNSLEVSAKDIVLKSVKADEIVVDGDITADNVTVSGQADIKELTVSGTADIKELTVSGRADIKELTVSGTATINNLNVTGVATGHYPAE